VALRERAAGAGFQVLLKERRLRFIPKLQRNHDEPWSVLPGVTAWTGVVPRKSFVDIASATHIVSIRVDVASQDVEKRAPIPRISGGTGILRASKES
jgi:hypothetical protein